MASRYLALLTIFALIATSVSGSRELNKVKAGLYQGGTLYLINDQGEMLSMDRGGPYRVLRQDVLGVPMEFMATASISVWYPQFIDFTFFGQNEIFFQHRTFSYPEDYEANKRRFPEFLWQGLDAATNEGPIDYFFKGCEYVKRENFQWHLDPMPMSDLQVPCDVDAAWYDQTDYIVLKGDHVWRIGKGIDQSEHIDDYFYQDKWVIKPKPENSE